MAKVRKQQSFPVGSVVVELPRKLFPSVFSPHGYHQEYPYIGADTYNLVIVSSGTYRSGIRDDAYRLHYSFIYSARSNKLYEWGDYYAREFGKRTTEVGGGTCFVECPPDRKDYNNPPAAVNVYASTAGVVWLVLRSLEPWVQNHVPSALTELDDAPFSAYFDLFDELDCPQPMRELFRTRLEQFFGLTLVEE